MAGKRKRWNKLGRFITGLVIGCFFMPFFGVSCQGVDVISVSGADMAGGCRPGGLIAAAEDQAEERAGGGMRGDVDLKIDHVDREALAIALGAIIVVMFGLAWVRSRGALRALFVLSLAGIGVLGALYVKVSGELHDMVDKELKKKGDAGPRMVEKDDVSAGSRFGLWLVGLGLIASAALTAGAMREPDPPA